MGIECSYLLFEEVDDELERACDDDFFLAVDIALELNPPGNLTSS